MRRVSSRLLLFSAPSREGLFDQLRAYDGDLHAVSLHRGGEAGAYRLAIVASTPAEFTEARERAAALTTRDTGFVVALGGRLCYGQPTTRERTACLFPGFGVKQTSLLNDLLAAYPTVEDWLDRLTPRSPTAPPPTRSGRLSRPLARTIDAVLLSDLAMWDLLQAVGVRVDAMAGHSYGENAMLVAAGMVADYYALVSVLGEIGARAAQLADPASSALGMLAFSDASRPLVEPLLAADPPRAYIALDNCPRQTVVWSDHDELSRLETEARARGHVVFRLAELVQPVHTPLYPLPLARIRECYQRLAVAPATVPAWSAATVERFPESEEGIRDLLARTWMSPVRFREVIRRLYDEGVRTFVEVGPADRLTGFVRDTLRGAPVTTIPTNLESRSTVTQLHTALAQLFVRGHDIDLRRLETENTTPPDPVARREPLPPRVVVQERLLTLVTAEVAGVLNTDVADLDIDAGLFDLGLGSMGCLELVERLERALHKPVPQTLPFDHPTIRRLAVALSPQAASGGSAVRRPALPSSAIAVVGIGCRFPGGGNHPDTFWQALSEGRDAVGNVPSDRWDVATWLEDAPSDVRARAGFGAFLGNVRDFDAAFFGISPREAEALDPQQRLLLEVTWEALEHAAIDPRSLAGTRTGVFVGISSSDYASRLSLHERLQVGGYIATGTTASTAAGRVSFVLGLQGPSLALDTACSSSLAAVHLACRSLLSGECDAAIAGGVNLLLSPETTIFLSQAQALSPTGHCRTFDAAADGYVRGEGCGVVVLKRLADAAKSDTVLAVIRGTAINHDGRTSGLTVPNGLSQEAVIRQALDAANLSPEDIGYIEAHGTGTSLGDPIEANALARVFDRGRDGATPLLLGSVKTNIGHLEAAAGVASLIKVVLQLQHRRLAPSLHFDRPNPAIAWQALGAEVVTQPIEWPVGRARVAGISSFGISGTNVHAVVSEAPVAERREHHRPGAFILPVSAATATACRRAAGAIADRLDADGSLDLAAVSRTLTIGRAQLPYRRAFIVRDKGEAIARLRALEHGDETVAHHRSSRSPRVAFLFTGQGAQVAGMGRQLSERVPVFRETLIACDELFAPHLGGRLSDVMFGPDQMTLNRTGWAQPALFAFEYALAQTWRAWGVEPAMVIGHSVGEIAAACVAGVMSLEDATRLVARRAALMQSLPPGGAMLAVEITPAEIAALLQSLDGISVAAINASEQVVVSGPEDQITTLEQSLRRNATPFVRLPVSHAFHSALMDPILDAFRKEAETIAFRPPAVPLYANLTGARADQAIATADYWASQIRQPVSFAEGVAALVADGAEIALEVGPKPTLTALGRRAPGSGHVQWLASATAPQNEYADILATVAALYDAGVAIDWRGVYDDDVLPRAVLPPYPFEREPYWLEPGARSSPALRRVTPSTVAPHAAAETSPQSGGNLTTYLQALVGAVLRLPKERPIDAWQPFRAVGFDSLMAMQLSAAVQQNLGVSIAPTTILQRGTVEALAAEIEATTAGSIGRPGSPADRGPEEEHGSLSYGQRALWFLWALSPESTAYNQSIPLEVGDVNDEALWRQAARIIVARHDVLRTRIVVQDGEPVTQTDHDADVRWSATDARGLSSHDFGAALVAAHGQPFDLAADPPIRFTWFRRESTAVLLLTLHHVACDAWSLEILRRELGAVRDTLRRGDSWNAPPPRYRYRDFVRWQQSRLTGESGERLLAFWRETLAEPREVIDLPTDKDRPAVQTYGGESCSFEIPAETTARLRSRAQASDVTLHELCLAAYLTLLHRWTRQRDLIVGVPTAGRTRPEFADIVGYFVDPVVVRALAAPDATFASFLDAVATASRAALAHSDIPFAFLVERLRVPRDPSRSPLFDVTFNFLSRRGLGAAPASAPPVIEIPQADGKFDLTLTVIEDDHVARGAFGFRRDLFDRATIDRLAAWFVTLVDRVSREPDVPLDRIALEEPHAVAPVVAGRRTAIDRLTPVHVQIAEQARRTPEAIAVVASDAVLTYRELLQRSTDLADRLMAAGVGGDVPVGLCEDRSARFVVGLLGILQAGGAFVPLEPSLPLPVRVEMLRQAGAGLCLQNGTIEVSAGPRRLHEPRKPAFLSNLAYVIFTSGSTGTPKGVAVEHRSLANYVASITEDLEIAPAASHAFVSSLAADLGHTVIFPSLTTGGALHVLSHEQTTDARLFAQYLRQHQIDYLKIVPSHLAALLDTADPALPRHAVFLGGESTSLSLLETWQRHGSCRFFNHYGPTETTVGVLTYAAGVAGALMTSTLPLNRAVANTDIWLLDGAQRPVPAGVPGELYVSGAALARGYIGDAVRTAERFVALPGIGRAYKTGDVARQRPDGSMVLLGREDRQLKVRGYRIELEHVEAVLSANPAVRRVVVLPDRDDGAASEVVAFVVPTSRPQPAALDAELQHWLGDRLPGYMIPSRIAVVDAIPLTRNGKIDTVALRGRLPDRAAHPPAPPHDATELRLARLWSAVLGREVINRDDDFFELGGHSLLAVRLAGRIFDEFGQRLPIASFFTHRTVASLAQVLRAAGGGPNTPLVRIQRGRSSETLVCFPGAGGSPLYFHALITQLGTDPTVWAAQAIGLGDEEPIPRSIVDLADVYVAAIERECKEGGVHLVGHSFGALVAFEVAHRLAARGTPPASVSVIDNPAPGEPSDDSVSLGERDWLRHIAVRIERLYGVDLRLDDNETTLTDDALLERLVAHGVLPPETSRAYLARFITIYRANVEAAAEYRPPAVLDTIPLRVFRASADDRVLGRTDAADATLGWQQWSRLPVESVHIPGTHITMLIEPHVGVLAHHLRAWLAHTQQSEARA